VIFVAYYSYVEMIFVAYYSYVEMVAA
jgi:hypothetical protein